MGINRDERTNPHRISINIWNCEMNRKGSRSRRGIGKDDGGTRKAMEASKEAMQNLQRICTKWYARRSDAKFADNGQWIIRLHKSTSMDFTYIVSFKKKISFLFGYKCTKLPLRKEFFFHQYLELSPTKIVPTRNARRSDTKFADNLCSGSPSAHIDVSGLQVCCCILVVFLLLLSLATNAQSSR